jgi:tetratricopeptide (TPR) repeat protein
MSLRSVFGGGGGSPAERALLRARKAMESGAARKAATEAETAFEHAVAAGDSTVARDAAALWLSALEAAGAGDERGVAAERCLRRGFGEAAALGAYAAYAAIVLRKTDPWSLERYVDAIEAGALSDKDVRRAAMRVLAAALYVAERQGDAPSSEFQRKLLERLAKRRPAPPFALFYLGRDAYRRRDYAEAVLRLERIGGRTAASPRLLNLLARALEKVGRLEQAADAYAASLRADARQMGVHFRLGRILLARYLEGVE